MFDVDGVSKAFSGRPALRPTTLRVPVGKTTALIGPSGCGKTTLLKLLVGLVAPDAGVVRFDGEPVTPANVRSVRRRVGYVVQDGGLFPHLSAGDNVTLMATRLGWPRDKIAARVAQLTELVRLPADTLGRYPGQLSGGQRQRVGIMRALMLDPPGLLLDEPMGALDPLVRADLQTDLRAIFRDLGKTAVLVTHDLAEAAALADLIVLLRDGEIVQQGTMADLSERPADPFVTKFVRVHTGAL